MNEPRASAAFSLETEYLLALRAKAEKFEKCVADLPPFLTRCSPDLRQENIGQAPQPPRTQADKMVAMFPVPLFRKFSRRLADPFPTKKKPPDCDGSGRLEIHIPLFHQQHLAGALDGRGEAALVMRGHAGVFARQDAALVGHILPEQGDVLEIQRVLGEVNFRLGARRALFRGAAVAALVFFGVRLAGHII
jgi:hypothetical protein